jgi:hypothetical protein
MQIHNSKKGGRPCFPLFSVLCISTLKCLPRFLSGSPLFRAGGRLLVHPPEEFLPAASICAGGGTSRRKVGIDFSSIRQRNFFLMHLFVRAEGLEPTHLAAPDPKSGTSTNFATPAKRIAKVCLHFCFTKNYSFNLLRSNAIISSFASSNSLSAFTSPSPAK